MRRAFVGVAAALSAVAFTPGSPASAATSLTTKLSLNQAAAEVTSKPTGTASINVAVMSNMAGQGLRYVRIPATQTSYTPPSSTPVVDMIADDSSGKPIGNWAGRLQTVPGGIKPASVTDKLSSSRAAVEVTYKPTGTASISVAVMANTAGEGLKYVRIPATQTSYTPPAATPVVDMIADDASGNPIGNWAGRLQTTPPVVVEPPPPPPPPPPPASSMLVSLNAGGWGPNELTDLSGVVGTLRIESISSSSAAAYASAGYKVIDDISGPYNSAGVKALNPQTFASEALARWKANPNIVAIEETNEPAGSWFWGPEATSEANVKAYAGLLKTVYEAFAPYGNARPKLLASYDGGGNKEGEWGARWLKLIDPKWIDGVTVHPYGGTGSRESSALGNRPNVERAHAETGLPVWVTEVGWPTAVGQPSTGDSLQWSWAEQASNITSFVKWCRGLGYVADVTLFQYRDYGTNAFYGIETSTGTRKPAYEALKTLSHE